MEKITALEAKQKENEKAAEATADAHRAAVREQQKQQHAEWRREHMARPRAHGDLLPPVAAPAGAEPLPRLYPAPVGHPSADSTDAVVAAAGARIRIRNSLSPSLALCPHARAPLLFSSPQQSKFPPPPPPPSHPPPSPPSPQPSSPRSTTPLSSPERPATSASPATSLPVPSPPMASPAWVNSRTLRGRRRLRRRCRRAPGKRNRGSLRTPPTSACWRCSARRRRG